MPSARADRARTHDLVRAGQSVWIDTITRGMLHSGLLQRYATDFGVTGLTSNPAIYQKAFTQTPDYREAIAALRGAGITAAEDLFFALAIEDLQQAADLFAPVHDSSGGTDGWVSLEVSPLIADDADATVASARELHQRLARPNAFVKIPGTPAGLHAVEEAIFHGVPVNVTLLFDREQYLGAVSAHQRGLQRRLDAGLPADVASVASVFISRWDTAIAGTGPDQLQGKLGVSIGAQVHAAHHGVLASQTQQALTAAGAPMQRLLFASTSTKDPSWPDTLYIEGLVAPGTITTVPEETLLAFADHGEVPSTLDPQAAVADEVLNQAHEAGIDLSALGARLQHEGTDAFVQAWSVLMSVLSETS